MESPDEPNLADPMNISFETLSKMNLNFKYTYPFDLFETARKPYFLVNNVVPTLNANNTTISKATENKELTPDSNKNSNYKKYHKVFTVPEFIPEQFDDELFLPITDYENYVISNYGRVFYIISDAKYYVKPSLVNDYLQVHLRSTQTNRFKYFYIHRLVAIHFIPNPLKKPLVDHIDSSSTNNKVSNLRWATFQENGYNKSLFKNNKSGYPGIKKTNTNLWLAQITQHGQVKYLGEFITFEEAVEARKKAEIIYFGEFANKNIL